MKRFRSHCPALFPFVEKGICTDDPILVQDRRVCVSCLCALHDEADAVQGVSGGGEDPEPPLAAEVVGTVSVEVVDLVAVADGDALPDDVFCLSERMDQYKVLGIFIPSLFQEYSGPYHYHQRNVRNAYCSIQHNLE